MAVSRPQLGEDIVTLRESIAQAEEVVRTLEANNWDFAAAPEAFARRAQCDVMAKEVAIFFDGREETMIGKLVMAGAGTHFNLMGGNHVDSEFMSKPNTVLEDINKELGTFGLREFSTFAELAPPQRIYFYNRTKFFQLRDMVFWLVLHGAGCFPSSLEVMKRHFTAGKAIHNNLYRPPRASLDPDNPAIMTSEGSDLFLSFPTDVIQFMEPSVHGGLVKETMHIEYLLTLEPTKVSHPQLPLADEGVIHIGGQRWHLRKFSGVSPKQGVRGPDVPPERDERPGGAERAAS
jgi:hypothetical protein